LNITTTKGQGKMSQTRRFVVNPVDRKAYLASSGKLPKMVRSRRSDQVREIAANLADMLDYEDDMFSYMYDDEFEETD
jgi:hypothetical protein